MAGPILLNRTLGCPNRFLRHSESLRCFNPHTLTLLFSLIQFNSMLYRTHMPSPFNPLPHFYLSRPLLNSPQFQGMEESKSGLAPENDVLGGNGAAACEDFCVDELLDFSNGFSETEVEELPEIEMGKAKMTPVLGEKREAPPPESGSFSVKEEFEALRESELTVQAEGLESLEWLSHFVEDSSYDYSLAGKLPPTENIPGAAAVAAHEQPCFATPVQTKARTRRDRGGVRVWPVLSSSFSDSPTSSSSSTLSTTSFPPFAPAKKQKKTAGDGGVGGAAQPRRCSHCGVTKTPQWRAGPLGTKTLCNACGVRFKSGRLLPEYRPACSPSFSSELHSNNHRKVLEMRQKKDATDLPPPVQSF